MENTSIAAVENDTSLTSDEKALAIRDILNERAKQNPKRYPTCEDYDKLMKKLEARRAKGGYYAES